MNFADVKEWRIPEGDVIRVTDSQNRVIWQKIDYTEPFYVENITNDNETLSIVSPNDYRITIEYKTDNTDWDTLGTTSSATALTKPLAPGKKIYLRCNTNAWGNAYSKNTIQGVSKVGGNIMSLLYGSGFTGTETSFPSGSTYNFKSLFNNNTNLVDTSKLLLPATTLTYHCYATMFAGCTSLIQVPTLSATTLTSYCYNSMFQGCTALTSPPALPATTLAYWCYSGMFDGCTSLTTAPALPATTLAEGCYLSMFEHCTSLTTAPALPATTLASYCYQGMFQRCNSLVVAPALPATTLVQNCYQYMFEHCTSLTTAPALPATTLAKSCYSAMFYGCTVLTQAPELPATTLTNSCYYQMFYGCILLSNVVCLATSGINTNYSTQSWLENVASSGTFTKAAGVTWPSGRDGIPSGWTVVNV